ncbi:AI-2E family transporter [Candidatus Kaiserbacteria bacterium]|nr:AI-2E family transporter [Candidatus Kaiserbacteria bacterium]
MDQQFKISITAGTIVTTLIVLVGAYVLWLLRDLALLVLTAIVIASAIEPGISFFCRRGLPRFIAALGMYVVVFGSVFTLLYFFFPPIIADAAAFLSTVPQYLDTLNVPTSFAGLANATDFLGSSHQAQSIVATLLSLKSAFSASSSGVVQLFATFFGGIFSLVLVVVLSFYFALQETGVDDFLRIIVPASHEEYAVNLWKRAQKKIGLWMQGQILLSLIVGVLIYLGLLIIGIPYALLLAVFTALAEIIPIFGSLMAGLAAVVVGYSEGGIAIAAIVVGLFVVVNQFETNLIYPLIVKKVIGIPPLLVIVALIAGGILAGFLGVLLSVPVAAVALEFLTDFEKRKRRAVSSLE